MRRLVNYLFTQRPSLLWGLAILALLFPIADLDNALHNPYVPRSRIPNGALISVAVSLLMTYPLLLFISRVTGRMRELIGTGKTVLLGFVTCVATVSITGEAGDNARWLTGAMLVDVLVYASVLCTIHFFVKGRDPFFASATGSSAKQQQRPIHDAESFERTWIEQPNQSDGNLPRHTTDEKGLDHHV